MLITTFWSNNTYLVDWTSLHQLDTVSGLLSADLPAGFEGCSVHPTAGRRDREKSSELRPLSHMINSFVI